MMKAWPREGHIAKLSQKDPGREIPQGLCLSEKRKRFRFSDRLFIGYYLMPITTEMDLFRTMLREILSQIKTFRVLNKIRNKFL
ncbi:hypothetical protein SAMN02746098_03559 [Desulfosporosinus lacus DSM 15449]|uniref:Uncharacterized protein n=1 Tax=Desulfosporosinus lacus DSM 15449 TaxID=1121420 RepID=A0A1M5ZRM3_9FIRM|nr:hypothetical protein SAMN02746098_03559 [Desulfosporosinus lacus DSM 15449]